MTAFPAEKGLPEAAFVKNAFPKTNPAPTIITVLLPLFITTDRQKKPFSVLNSERTMLFVSTPFAIGF